MTEFSVDIYNDLKGYRIIQISDLHNAEFGYDNENVDISVGDSNFCFIGLDENSLTSNTLKNIMEKIEKQKKLDKNHTISYNVSDLLS